MAQYNIWALPNSSYIDLAMTMSPTGRSNAPLGDLETGARLLLLALASSTHGPRSFISPVVAQSRPAGVSRAKEMKILSMTGSVDGLLNLIRLS